MRILPLEGGKGKEHTREKQKGREDFAVRRWEGEGTHEKQKRRKSRGCNRGFLRVFSLKGLGLSFMLKLNLEEGTRGIKFKRSGFYGGDRLKIILVLLVF